jgi:hypothetical protein
MFSLPVPAEALALPLLSRWRKPARTWVAIGRDPNPGSSCDAISSAGRKTFYFSGDLADPNACSGLFEKTIAEFGSLDMCVGI